MSDKAFRTLACIMGLLAVLTAFCACTRQDAEDGGTGTSEPPELTETAANESAASSETLPCTEETLAETERSKPEPPTPLDPAEGIIQPFR